MSHPVESHVPSAGFGPAPLQLTDSLVVLIVDDVPDNVAPLHDALDEAGYTVLVALDGESAIRRATQALPDVVLLDAVMPGLDGFEVARRLKAQPATAQIPIIFMTGLTDTEHLVAALEAGHEDDRDLRRGRLRLEPARHLEAVQARH
ncbi:MAG: response regulator, partial [Rubrivivax sp.]